MGDFFTRLMARIEKVQMARAKHFIQLHDSRVNNFK